MKKLVLSLLFSCSFFPSLSLAEPYPQLDIQSVVAETAVNIEQLKQAVSALQQFAGTYPPQFDNNEDKERATQDSGHIAHIFKVLLESNTLDPKNTEQRETFLTIARNGWVAHNLDINGAREEAKKHYQTAIALSRDKNEKAFYQQEFGEFLTSAGWAREGEQMLRQAIKVRPEAGLALGMNLLGQKKINPAAAVMKRYVKNFPDDPKGQALYQALRAGTVHFK